jgi:uncharacterized cupin superfamily protein
MRQRPDFIRHGTEIQNADAAHYPGSQERLSVNSRFGRVMGFPRIGVNHELLPPGRRTSWPHAEGEEEEFFFVLEGRPDAGIDGALYRRRPGDGVGFRTGTGIAQTFINNTDADVRLLVVGERERPNDRYHTPLRPQRNAEIGEQHWRDTPVVLKGGHDGLPDALRAYPADSA